MITGGAPHNPYAASPAQFQSAPANMQQHYGAPQGGFAPPSNHAAPPPGQGFAPPSQYGAPSHYGAPGGPPPPQGGFAPPPGQGFAPPSQYGAPAGAPPGHGLAPPPGPAVVAAPVAVVAAGPPVLRVRVIGASGLAAADINGKSDPYAKIRWEGIPQHYNKQAGQRDVAHQKAQKHGRIPKVQTTVCHKTLNPMWNQTFEMNLIR